MKDMQIARNVNPFVERLDCPIAKRKKTEQEHLLHIFFSARGKKNIQGCSLCPGEWNALGLKTTSRSDGSTCCRTCCVSVN
jgi:hypothetical protein